MPVLHITPDPRLTRRLVSAGVFADGAFLLVDVGASGGTEGHWAALGRAARHVAFEPDPEECRRLNAEKGDTDVTYYPCALAGRTGPRSFYVRRFGAGCSFHRLDDLDALRRFFPDDFVDMLGDPREIVLDAVAFDDFAARENLPCPDFLKLDAEGAELEILQGAARALGGDVFGACIEVRFDEPMAPHGAFWEVDRLMQSHGYRLFDLDVMRYGRRALPQPYLYDYRDGAGRRFPGPTIAGKPQVGDALYLRDVVDDLRRGRRAYTPRRLLKACCLYELYGFPDYAAEVLLEMGEAAGPQIEGFLDLLVPEVKGERLSYREHVRSQHERPERFRPARGRFPEAIVSQYEGTFLPAWAAGGAASA